MNQQKTEELAAKLAKIWTPTGCQAEIRIEEKLGRPDIFLMFDNGTYFRYTEQFGGHERYVFSTKQGGPRGCLYFYSYEKDKITNGTYSHSTLKEAREAKRFAKQWTPFFKLACAESGALEATAHQKLEWHKAMQEFEKKTATPQEATHDTTTD
ncbi:hypothetical protein IAD21_00926 [Abditibacteriota bacterium]|nr:hypothetical protein IAD21_00926 [Abditibacteriota bacterium]